MTDLPADDHAIRDDDRALRRVHPKWVVRESDGTVRLSSAAFRDDEMSINLKSLMSKAGRPPEDTLTGYPDFGLAEIVVADIRSLKLGVVAAPTQEEPAHAIVTGRKTQSVCRKLRDRAACLVWPRGA